MKWGWRYWLAFLLILLGFSCIVYFSFSDAFNDWSFVLNSNLAAQYGTFIGGFVGSLFSLAGVLLLFETLNSQKFAFQRQQFENSFFHLLSIYRENVSEMEHTPCTCGGEKISGRRVFIELRKQFGDIFKKVSKICVEDQCELTEIQLVDIAFTLLIFGIGESTKEIVDRLLYRYDCKPTIDKIIVKFAFEADDDGKQDGHQSRLGHYFRHLYQFVSFVDNAPYLKETEKKAFVKIIRAQMSTFELVIFFVNILSAYGRPWWQGEENLIAKYELLKNIPSGFVFGIEPKKYFRMNYEEDERLNVQV